MLHGNYGEINLGDYMILRSKTKGLLQTRELTEKQLNNTKLNQEEMDSNNTILKSYPQRLVLELTNACNLKCIMCGRDEAEFKPTLFKLDYLKKMEHILYTIEEVTLFGWGEPTMHPQFIDILKYLHNFPVRKYFVTNGMKLDQIKDAIFNYQVDIIAVSIDGANAETNDRIRAGGNFNTIVNNIKKIQDEKRKRNLSYPYMNFVMALMDSNIEQLPDLIKLAYEIGLEEVKGVYLTTFTKNLLNESLYNKQDKVVKIFDESEKIAKKLDIKLKLPYIQGEDIAGDKYHKDCFVAYRDFFLASDGYVRPCQSTHMKFLKFENYDTFEEIWNSQPFQDFRKIVNDQEKMNEECKRCFQSSHANWNKEKSFIQINEKFAPEWEK